MGDYALGWPGLYNFLKGCTGCTNLTTLMYSPALPPLLTYVQKQENFKADAARHGHDSESNHELILSQFLESLLSHDLN